MIAKASSARTPAQATIHMTERPQSRSSSSALGTEPNMHSPHNGMKATNSAKNPTR